MILSQFCDDFSIFGGASHTKILTGHLLSPTVSEANRGGRTDYYVNPDIGKI